ncbi:MAG: YibE/F family protein [Spirochaetia bacterium]|nr:YibE/F family protein [Spirochaetia bacterium]
MKNIKDTMRHMDKILVVFIGLITLFLLFMPTGYEQNNRKNVISLRGKITEVDNTQVEQYGIIKTGEQKVSMRVLSMSHRGEILKGQNQLAGRLELDKIFKEGDTALINASVDDDGNITSAVPYDHYRLTIEVILLAVFMLFLVIYAGWTGVKALFSFLFTGVLIWKVMIPGFLNGYNPILLTAGIVIILTGVIIFLVGGFKRRGLSAFLGAVSGVGITAAMSIGFGNFFSVHGAVKPFSETLLYSGFAHLDLTAIFISGIFLANSGAVMDIAMDISASMEEIRYHHPRIGRKELMMSGFKVGRAVVGTMTTTLLLAYSGGFTALLMVFMAQGTPMVNMLNLTYVSAEILHTLVGSFGLVLVAPFTAIIGSYIFQGGTDYQDAA